MEYQSAQWNIIQAWKYNRLSKLTDGYLLIYHRLRYKVSETWKNAKSNCIPMCVYHADDLARIHFDPDKKKTDVRNLFRCAK